MNTTNQIKTENSYSGALISPSTKAPIKPEGPKVVLSPSTKPQENLNKAIAEHAEKVPYRSMNNSNISIAVPYRTPNENQVLTTETSYINGNRTSVSRNGFLWKPVSEKNGKLVVLLPQSITGKVENAAIYSSLPPSPEKLIESGKFSGDTHNGGRAHFRFSKPGSSYPDGVHIVAQLKDGSYTSFNIGDTARRNN